MVRSYPVSIDRFQIGVMLVTVKVFVCKGLVFTLTCGYTKSREKRPARPRERSQIMFQYIKANKKFSVALAAVFVLVLTAAFGLAVGNVLILGVSLALLIPATVSAM